MSDDLDFDFARAAPWFPPAQEHPYVLVRVSDGHAKSWADTLRLAVRRCYVSDSLVTAKATEHSVDQTEIIAARLPDPGATMAGDFGVNIALNLIHLIAPELIQGDKQHIRHE